MKFIVPPPPPSSAQKTLIVFGAGASNGSEDSSLDQPPLMKDVLSKFAPVFPKTWGLISANPTYREIFEDNFEKGMSQLLNDGSDFAIQCHRDLARGFFNYIPSSKSLYRILVNKIKAKGISNFSLISLNYERCLPIALAEEGIEVYASINNSSSLQVASSSISSACGSTELLLPHGCCHLFAGPIFNKGKTTFSPETFLRFSKGGQHKSTSTNSWVSGDISGEGNICFAHDNSSFLTEICQRNPVMSYITGNKSSHAGHSFLDFQRQRIFEVAQDATKIVLIGINYQEHDDHIWLPFQQSKTAEKFQFGGKVVPGFKKIQTYFDADGYKDVLNCILS